MDPILNLLESVVIVVNSRTILGREPSHEDLHKQTGHEIAAVRAEVRVVADICPVAG